MGGMAIMDVATTTTTTSITITTTSITTTTTITATTTPLAERVGAPLALYKDIISVSASCNAFHPLGFLLLLVWRKS